MKVNQTDEQQLKEEIRWLQECIILVENYENPIREAVENSIPKRYEIYVESHPENLKRQKRRLELDLEQLKESNWSNREIRKDDVNEFEDEEEKEEESIEDNIEFSKYDSSDFS